MTEGLRCKECGAPVDRSIEFCTACGAYLGWTEEEVAAAGGEAAAMVEDTAPVAVAPAAGHAPPASAAPPPAASPRPTIEGGKFCPGCGASNPPSRTFCSRCAIALEGASAPTEPVPVVSAGPGGGRRFPVLPIVALVIVVIAVGIVLLTRGGDNTPTASGPATSVAPSAVDTTVAGPATDAQPEGDGD